MSGRRGAAFLFAAVALALFACQPAGQQPPAAEEKEKEKTAARTAGDVQQQIDQIRQQWQEAYNAGDATRIADLYTEDAQVFPPLAEPQDGREAMRSHLEGEFQQGERQLSIHSGETIVHDDAALEYGSYTNRITPAQGEAFELSGHYIVTFGRQDEGSWKITHHIWNLRNPPPAAAQGARGKTRS